MRSIPILWRMAEDLKRLAMPSTHFLEHPWITSYRWSPLSQLNRLMEEDLAKISKDGYQVSMKVAEYKPEELSVKVVENGVMVEGRSEQNSESGDYISRYFARHLVLPCGFEADNAISTLSSDGVLTVSVPKTEIEEKAREIPIHRTEVPTVKSSEDSSSAKKDNN